MLRFQAQVDGVDVLDRAFNRTEGYIADMRNFAGAIADEFYRAEHEQFESQGARGASGRWAALSPAYAKYKAQRWPGKTILMREDNLRNSLTSRDALDAIYIVDQDELILGTQVEYANVHHRGRGRLPARPVISLSDEQKRRMQKAIQRQLVEFTRRAGFVVEEAA